MSITTQDGFVAAMASGVEVDCGKASLVAKGAGTVSALWKVTGAGGQGVTGAAAPTGANPDKTTTGSLVFANGGAQLYCMGGDMCIANAGTVRLYDRQWHGSGFVANVTTAQAMTATLPARETGGGVGVEAWLEVDTAIGATPTDATLTYVGATSGATLQAVAKITASMIVGQCARFMAAEGIASASQVQLTGSTGTAGAFSVVLRKKIATFPCQAGQATARGPFDTRMPKILNNACLELLVDCSTTATGELKGSITIGNG